MRLSHPELGRTIDVPDNSVHVYLKSGWVDPNAIIEVDEHENDENDPLDS